jgi:hypothetical protein
MAIEPRSPNWLDVKTQHRWYKLRHDFEGELRGATDEIRRDYDVEVKLNTATITADGGRSVLRIPISASWRNQQEQTIAALLVSNVEEDELRLGAIADGVAELLQRWIEREVPVGASPEFLYPEREVRWPDEPESHTAAAQAATEAADAKPVVAGQTPTASAASGSEGAPPPA